MPSGGYSEKRLPVSGVQWVQMNDYNDIAHDHCGATAATNLAMYFSNQGYFDLEKGSARDTLLLYIILLETDQYLNFPEKSRSIFPAVDIT